MSSAVYKLMAIYSMVLVTISYGMVAYLYWQFTGINIDVRNQNCDAGAFVIALIWFAISAISLLLHMATGYLYYSSRGEGAYGPLKPGQRPKPDGKGCIPYVTDWGLAVCLFFPFAFSFPRC